MVASDLSSLAKAARDAVPAFVNLDPADMHAASLAIRGYEDGDTFDADGNIVCGVCGRPKEEIFEYPIQEPSQKSTESGLDCSVRRFRAPMVHLHCREEKDALYEAERLERIKRSSLGKWYNRYSRASLYCLEDGRPETEAANSFVRNFRAVREKGAKLFLYGPKGTGKTYAAAAIANELVPRHRVMLTSIVELDREMQADPRRSQAIVRHLCDMDLVVLDDLGEERRTETARETATWIVDSLYSAKVPLVVTSNMTLAEISSPASDMGRIMDRLKETCRLVEVAGRNKRQSGA